MPHRFGEKIIQWYGQHRRDLPWRRTKDPYKIWLSEIILQQTRVEQGKGYYNRFVSRYPSVSNLARAREADVLKLWQGLGYYSRARNLHAAAREIATRFKGRFPSRYEDIRSLKGVGDYTAAAISAFAFDGKYPAIDGNAFRVLSRYLGIATPIHTALAKTEFSKAAMELMAGHSPSDFNQAVMEIGALVCKPQSPACGICPVNNSCYAFSKKITEAFPVKDRKVKVRNRYFNYLLIRRGKHIHLCKRTGTDIWKNLYDFPLIETPRRISTKSLISSPIWKQRLNGAGGHLLSETKTVKHQLSHQTIHARFFEVSIPVSIKIPGTVMVQEKQVSNYAMPKLIENYLRQSGIL